MCLLCETHTTANLIITAQRQQLTAIPQPPSLFPRILSLSLSHSAHTQPSQSFCCERSSFSFSSLCVLFSLLYLPLPSRELCCSAFAAARELLVVIFLSSYFQPHQLSLSLSPPPHPLHALMCFLSQNIVESARFTQNTFSLTPTHSTLHQTTL